MSKFSYRTKVLFAFIALSLTAFMLVLSFQGFRIFQIFSAHTPTQSSNQIPVGISSLSSYGQSFFISFNQDNDIRVNGAKAFQEALNLLPNDAKGATAKLDEAIEIFSTLTDKDNIQVLSGDTMYSLDTLKLKDKAKNLVIVVHWLRSGQLTEFEKQAKLFWGNTSINWRTATSYDAAQVIATALSNSQQLQNSKKDIREDLQKIISAPNFSAQGAFNDPVRFEAGDRKVDENSKFGVLGRVTRIGTDTNGQDKYDFQPI